MSTVPTSPLPETTSQDRCTCLAARRDTALVTPSNVPGLSAVAYRIGRHADFKRRLLAGLSAAEHRALAGLQTRGDDDFTVALLDAFATVADVLCFYQERIANESYLRTATERRSVLELARLTGYRPSPGVAASVALAFTLEDAPGAAQPPVREVTIPVGAQVRSIPGPDETAQTFETVEAITARYEWNALEPVTTKPQTLTAETAEIWVEGLDTRVRVGDGLLLRKAAGPEYVFRTVVGVSPDTTHRITCLSLSSPLGSAFEIKIKDSKVEDPKCFVLRQRAAVFGHNAPNPCLLNLSNTGLAATFFDDKECEWIGHGGLEWKLDGDTLDLDSVYPGIRDDSFCVLVRAPMDFFSTIAAAFFQARSNPSEQPTPLASVLEIRGASEVSLRHFALSGKVTRLFVSSSLRGKGFKRRETTVYLQPEQLTLSRYKPIPTDHKVSDSSVTVKGLLENVPLPGQPGVLLEADGKGGWAPQELIEIRDIQTDGETTTTLNLVGSLAKSYAPAKVRINLNIARATHGETVHEILGSGDARIPSQRFTLKQPPLTYVPVDSTAGARSTLDLRVDDILWTARDSFVGAGPRDRVYTQSIADDGTVTLQFGDGISGARLPTGQSNVRARYRKGSGLGGLVGAGQLSLLMTRPLGVKAVINPEAASGAEDPETLDTARTTTPIRVLTLDRAVSLKDYQDFARTFPGIAKARAEVHPTRAGAIFVTVAGAKGAQVDKTLASALSQALLAAGNPHLTIQVQSYRPAPFELAARIEVRPNYLKEKVAAAVATALTDAFSFERATLGGHIWRSQVIALIQRVPGVAAVDIKRFARAVCAEPAAQSGSGGAGAPAHGWGGYAAAFGGWPYAAYPAWASGGQASWWTPAVTDSITADPADPEHNVGAELLVLDTANLKLDTVDAL